MYSELASNSHKYIRKMEDDSSDEQLTQDSNDTNDDTAPSLGRHPAFLLFLRCIVCMSFVGFKQLDNH